MAQSIYSCSPKPASNRQQQKEEIFRKLFLIHEAQGKFRRIKDDEIKMR